VSWLHHASAWFYVQACALVARIERDESETEHAVNELTYEWDHIVHTVPLFVASVTERGGH